MFHGLENGPTTKLWSSSMEKEVLLESFLINGLFCYFFLVIEIFSVSVYEKMGLSVVRKQKNGGKGLLTVFVVKFCCFSKIGQFKFKTMTSLTVSL